MAIRVLVADDHQLMREGLVSLLSDKDGFEVVGQADTGRRALELAEELRPDVVVLDIAMPDLNGIEAARTIRARLPQTRVIGLSMHSEHRFVVDMLKAGACAYLPKSCAFDELGRAICCAHEGRMYLSPSVTEPVLSDLLNRLEEDPADPPSVLSPREREVLQLVAEGKSTKQIAAALHVSQNTVIRHRQNIMDKLGIHHVAGLTRYAIREGLSHLD